MAEKSQVSLVDDYVSEYQGIQAQMGDPEVAGDQDRFRKLSKRYAELQPIINVYNDLTQAQEDHEAAAEMAGEDKEFAEEAKRLEGEIVRLEEELADLLAPRDEHDGDDVIMELKAGAGGEEAALLFALLPGSELPEQAKGLAVGLNGELPETAAEQAQLHAASQGAPAAKASGSASAAPATLTAASSDPQIEALNSLAALQIDLQGEAAAKPAVAQPGQAAQGTAATQPAALFGQAMAALQAQAEGQAAEGESTENGLLEVSASTLENSAGNKIQAQPESFAGRLNALAQAITQQTGRSPSLLVPGQPLAVQQGGMSESLVDKVMWLSSQNLKSAEIQLDPAELGRLEVRIELTKDQAAQVTFASPNAAVREALEAQQHRLRELFAQQGMGQLDVNVSDQSLNRGWQGQQAEEHGRGSARHSDDDGLGSESVIAQGQLDIRSRQAGGVSGLVDFYA